MFDSVTNQYTHQRSQSEMLRNRPFLLRLSAMAGQAEADLRPATSSAESSKAGVTITNWSPEFKSIQVHVVASRLTRYSFA